MEFSTGAFLYAYSSFSNSLIIAGGVISSSPIIIRGPIFRAANTGVRLPPGFALDASVPLSGRTPPRECVLAVLAMEKNGLICRFHDFRVRPVCRLQLKMACKPRHGCFVISSFLKTRSLFFFFRGIAQLARACGSYPQCPRFKSRCRYQIHEAPRRFMDSQWPVGQVVKTRPFHGCNMGSNPVRVTIP